MKKETSSGGIVFNKNKNPTTVLLIKHAGTNYWGFPKGLVADKNQNETLTEAALREVQEEGGVKAKILSPIKTPSRYQTNWRGQLVDKTVYYFVMHFLSGNTKDHDQEVSEAKFMTIDKALDTLTYQNDKQVLKQALAQVS
jgi:ADP-ribose pyrophosphatase YjhB (NUDIX family)